MTENPVNGGQGVAKGRSALQALLAGSRRQAVIALGALAAIALHLLLRFGFALPTIGPGMSVADVPLLLALLLGGGPLVFGLLVKLWRREFGSDLLAGISIVTSVMLGEYLAGTLVVLMLSGGEALEAYAVRSASSVLRRPGPAHALASPIAKQDGQIADVPLDRRGRRRHAGRLPARDLPGRRHRGRRARRHGRVVPHRRAVHDVQDAGLRGAVGRDQRRRRR